MYRKKGALEAEGKCQEGRGGKGEEGKGKGKGRERRGRKGGRIGKVGGDVRVAGWVGRKEESSNSKWASPVFLYVSPLPMYIS